DGPAVARAAIDRALVESTARLLTSGGFAGDVRQDGRLLRLRVVPEQNLRGPADELREATVRGGPGAGQPIPLGFLGHPRFVRRPALVRAEGGQLVAYVYVTLTEGTDLAGYVERTRLAVERAPAIALGPGERIEWTGQYDLMVAGRRRLVW